MKIPSLVNLLGLPQIVPQRPTPPPVNFDPKTLGPKETFLKWHAASRATVRTFSPKFSRTFLAIGIVIAFLLVIMQEFILILMVASLFFLTYVLSKTAPESLDYEINNHGILVGEQIYYWHDLRQFFFIHKNDVDVLCVDTYLGVPARLYLTINIADRTKIYEYLEPKLNYLNEEPKTPFDKAYDNVMSKFNFE